jgi:ferric-dicitrate binding protein FerR (iron transport regulator)
MNDDAFWTRLDRYLAGEATPADKAEVERWMSEDPSRRKLIEALRDQPRHAWNVDAAWQRARLRMGDTDTFQSHVPDGVAPPAGRVPWLKAAAIAALVTGAAAVWQFGIRERGAPATATIIAVTTAGQRDTVTLADGSVAVLAPESRIESHSSGRIREVKLSGEAFFDVVADAEHPFRVDAGAAVIEVLGTEFSVRARNDTASAVVVVREGRVSLRARNQSAGVVLGEGEVGQAGPDSAFVLDSGAEGWLAWLAGDLQFESAALRDVVAELHRWFGQEVRVADTSLYERKVTGRFRASSIEQVLDALALALGLRYERDSAGWTIRSR